jgi:RNA polymerase sigma factor (sigma-70 family)
MPLPSATVFRHLRRLASPPPGDADLLDRWLRHRDEEAFTALVVRHGPMVRGVCQRILGNAHDAEDAMQATFLILARKAASLRHPEALAGWLHGVALRLARKARYTAERRRLTGHTQFAPEPADPHSDPLDLLSARDLLALIDAEIARLPEVYRLALVLCDLEERTQEEAARLLGWTPGSLRGRLLRGRAQLRQRLARRGVAPSVLPSVLVAGSTLGSANAALLSTLAAAVSRAAILFSTCPTSADVSPEVAALARLGLRGLPFAHWKLMSALLLAVSVSMAGAGLVARQAKPAQDSTDSQLGPSSLDVPGERAAKPSERRDQDGEPLPAEAVARLGTTRFRHGGLIDCLEFTPDGKTLVSCGPWNGLQLWETATGKQSQPFPDQASANSVALSADGKLLAALDRNRRGEPIALHDFATGQVLRRFGAPCNFSSLRFSPDGKVLAGFRWTKTIQLWDPAAGRLLHTLAGHQDIVWGIAFAADGRTLASCSDDKTIRFWDVATGAQVRQITHTERIGHIALSPDGKLLASIDVTKEEFGGGTSWRSDHRVRLWNVDTAKELRQLVIPAEEVSPGYRAGFISLGFSPDGTTLVTGEVLTGILRIWDPATGRELRRVAELAGTVGPFTFSRDGKKLAVAHGNGNVRILDPGTVKALTATHGHQSFVSSAAVTPDGQTIVTMGGDRTLRFWNPATGREQRRLPVLYGYGTSQILPDGKSYLEVGSDKLLHLHDLASGKELTTLRGLERDRPFALAPDHRTFATWASDKMVRIIDVDTGKPRHTLIKVDDNRPGMAFGSDSRSLVVWSPDQTVTVWDTATGKKRREFTGPGQQEPAPMPVGRGSFPYTAALSPDGELLAFGLQGLGQRPGTLPVFATETGKQVCCFATGEDGACQLAFSPDGKTLAWAGWRQGIIYLGEIPTGLERRRFTGHRGRIGSLAFSTDGRTLISGSEDTTAMVWDLTGKLAAPDAHGKPLTDETLTTHWTTLSAEDAAAAYRAVQALAADPARSIPYLRQRLHPVAAIDHKHLTRLITDLDSDRFEVRDRATKELAKLGEQALNAVRKALDGEPTLETKRRLEQLLEEQERGRWSISPERLRTRRSLEVLERAATPEARRVLEALSAGAPGAWLTSDAKACLARLSNRP